jgi:hypothetical protein
MGAIRLTAILLGLRMQLRFLRRHDGWPVKDCDS